MQQRLKDMIALESELVNRDIQITSLKDELTQTKASTTAQRRTWRTPESASTKVKPFFTSDCRASQFNRLSFPLFLFRSRSQGDLSCVRSAHSEELSLLARERDAATARLEGAEGEAGQLKKRIRDADMENEVCEEGRGGRGGSG